MNSSVVQVEEYAPTDHKAERCNMDECFRNYKFEMPAMNLAGYTHTDICSSA